MKIQDRSWPHPVLAPFRDDILPNAFSFDLSVSADREYYYLKYKIQLEHKDIPARIQSGEATLCMHIEGRRTFYRELRKLDGFDGRLTIPASTIRGTIEVFCCVLAASAIANYAINGQHADYENHKFSISEGDFLAVTETQHFDAYLDFDPLKKISSILTIRRSKEIKEGPMQVVLAEQKIVAELSQQDFERYIELKRDGNLIPILANQVVVPSLMEAVAKVAMTDSDNDAYEEYMELLWFRSVTGRLKQLKIDVWNEQTSVGEAVQLLVELPLRRSLAELNRLVDEGDET